MRDYSGGETQQALHAAIEHVYAEFARYPLRDRIEGCDHCVDPAYNDVLHAKPLRELNGEDLSTFVGNLSTWGDIADFKHFLPRLLELCAMESQPREERGSSFFSASLIIARHLYATHLQEWPAAQREAVGAFLRAWLRAELHVAPSDAWGYESQYAVEEVLQLILWSAGDVLPFLDMWREQRVLSAAYALCHLVYRWHLELSLVPSAVEDYVTRVLRVGPQAQVRQVLNWLREPTTATHVREVWDEALAQRLPRDVAILDGYRRRIIEDALAWWESGVGAQRP